MHPEGIHLVAGPPGGGKTTVALALQSRLRATRLNRDTIGGRLSADGEVYQQLRRNYAEGVRRFVLDNVYPSRESRAIVIALGKELGLPVFMHWLETTREQAELFAALRQVRKYGKLFTKDDYQAHRDDPGMFPPAAQFAYWKRRVPPTQDEGFAGIDFLPVETTFDPEVYKNRAIIFDYDGTLRRAPDGQKWPVHPGQVKLLSGRREKVRALKDMGWLLLGASNQSGVSKKPGEPGFVSDEDCRACFDRTNELLGADIQYLYATDRGGVPQTYWRKPAPGMGALLIETFKLDPAACYYVGDMKIDQTFAARCGFQFRWADEFFGV